uniref:Uncharacterized protein n=1 Tax=Acrobeloides nanus TaxID=290746 RepID=A0A914EMZ0_9BILA
MPRLRSMWIFIEIVHLVYKFFYDL